MPVMTSFLKFSFNLPRVPSLGEEREVGEVVLGEFAFVLNDELVLLKLEAAVEAIVDNDVVMELGIAPPPVEFNPFADCCNTSKGNKFEFSTRLS